MQTVVIKTKVRVHDLPWPAATLSFDGLGRLSQARYDFQSVRVAYDVTWVGDTNDLETYTETVTDLP